MSRVVRSMGLALILLSACSAIGCSDAASAEGGKFTKENYDKIKKGTTIAECEALLGPCTSRKPPEKGQLTTETGLIDVTSEKLTWRGEGSREFNAKFLDGKLSIQPIPYDTKLTLENFRKLKSGMTLKQCEDILGPSQPTREPPREIIDQGVTYRSVFRQWEIPDHGSFQVRITNDMLKDKEMGIFEYWEKYTTEDDGKF